MSSGNLRELPLFADIVDHDRKGLSYHVIGKADGTSISDHTYQMTSDDNMVRYVQYFPCVILYHGFFRITTFKQYCASTSIQTVPPLMKISNIFNSSTTKPPKSF